MKLIGNILLALVLTNLASCATSSPSIVISNYSKEPLYNIKVIWNGYHLLKSYKPGPGARSSQILWSRSKSDFFGPVNVTWENAKREKLSKNFVFKRKELWGIYYKRFNDVQLYFTQSDMDYFTTDNPNYTKISHLRSAESSKWGSVYSMKKCYEKYGENSRKCSDKQGFLTDKCKRDFGSKTAKQCINLDRCYKKLGENTPKCNDAMEMKVIY